MKSSKKLFEIADISAGLVTKRKEANPFEKDRKAYNMLTLRGFNEKGFIDMDVLDTFFSKDRLDFKYFTQEKDIVIRLSQPYTALTIDQEATGILIPSNFAVIRIKNLKSYHPGYVSFVLNMRSTKQDYYKNSFGITIPILKVSSIRDTEIPLKDYREQVLFSKIHETIIRQERLSDDLIEQRKKIVQCLEYKIKNRGD